ncbi:hypothetical protein NLG97_g6867 [Lecanicillium saksenae]|uniref:Uncharacterized protein n=1 Tax=Lecanicillium saksenae TaxID=468837 RepID=A0ACC1QNZ3_9HYPO|nr:hypothetical protein NLG97_g6867 [Lecanicillium saksenae]
MNASALLTAQGWRGKGHSLHKTDDSVGLAKPLLLNRKDNTRGIGATQHFTSDQWWMNAFDEQLQGLDTSKKGKVVQTITTGKLNAIEKGSLGKYSLYTTFVRGGFLEGTIESLKKQQEKDESTSDSDSESDDSEKKAKKTKPATESKEERRARKEAKRKRREEKAQRKLARKSKKSKSKSDSSDDAAEEKRRRRARKEEKRRRRKEEGK